MAAVHNLYVDQGASFDANIQVYDGVNQSWDLTGYTADAKIKKSYYSATSTDFTATALASGIVQLSLSSSQTSSLEQGRYLYDVVITAGDGKRTRVLEGIVTINPGVTI
jgi:hypothetical protein